jgi:hypothetical protein
MKIETVIDRYVEVRDKRAELKRKYEEKDAELKNAAARMEAWLLERLNKDSVDRFVTSAGTAYIHLDTKASCADWPGLWEWMAENRRFNLLEKRVAIGAIKEYEEDTGELPPFINKTVERIVRVRRG